jgi:hypothetical protein
MYASTSKRKFEQMQQADPAPEPTPPSPPLLLGVLDVQVAAEAATWGADCLKVKINAQLRAVLSNIRGTSNTTCFAAMPLACHIIATNNSMHIRLHTQVGATTRGKLRYCRAG